MCAAAARPQLPLRVKAPRGPDAMGTRWGRLGVPLAMAARLHDLSCVANQPITGPTAGCVANQSITRPISQSAPQVMSEAARPRQRGHRFKSADALPA